MIHFHPFESCVEIERDNPLHVSRFFDLSRMWWKKRKQRQAMVVSVAVAWYHATHRSRKAPAFIEDEIHLTSLTSQVKDAKNIITKFFTIKRIGYNFNNGMKSPTIVSPKKLTSKMMVAIEDVMNGVEFDPGPAPSSPRLTKSKVRVRQNRWSFIHDRLLELNREDLIAPVKWLCDQEQPLTFYFFPMGKLQARDTSMWPIKNIELWPGWLRKELFGTVVDIENAYCQFLFQHLYKKYETNSNRLELKYPDIIRADRDKKNFREELCQDVLKLPITDVNIGVVKRLIMSLANGSNASPALMLNDSGRSEAVRIVRQANPDLTSEEMREAGRRLAHIAKQFRAAKKDVCVFVLGDRPSAENVKKVFRLYFNWEREMRYKIWELTNFTGLALHDGLDGILVDSPEAFRQEVLEKTGLRVSVEA